MRNSILVIGDTHIPFEVPGYLEFCKHIYDRCKCEKVVHIGDLVDNHAINYWEHDPDGDSPLAEMNRADEHLVEWFRIFPEVYLCRGNHDRMVDRKGKTSGLPSRALKDFREIWKLPVGWYDDWQFEIDGVRFQHGTGYSGDNAHLKAAYNNRQSTVIGHTHSQCSVGYLANEKDCVFGMNVGCGILRKSYAFNYGRDFKKKPIVSCGIVTDKGKYCQVFPMEL